jgi:signal transduction histidine kinase
METLFQQILNLLIQPPGNLIYHLVLAFSVVTSLQAAIITRNPTPGQQTGRMIFGLIMLLLGQVILFVSSGLAWQGILNEQFFLPPLDRAIVVYSLIWIVWLWNFPTSSRLGDIVTGFLNLGVILLFLFTYISWTNQGTGASFNATWMDFAWELAGLFIVLTGMAMLLFSRPPGWGFGMGMLSLSLVGFAGHLLMPPASGHYAGFIRLGQLAAFPLLPTLLQRIIPVSETAVGTPRVPIKPVDPNAPQPPMQERRRYSTDPRTVRAWLEINQAAEPEDVFRGMAKAVAYTMLSDLCFVVSVPNYGYVVLQSGFDLIREEEMKGTLLEQGQMPALSNAVQRGKPLRITMNDSQPQDMKTLGTALGLNETGSLLYVPLFLDEKPYGGLLFLSPYSNRQWSTDDQNYLASEIELIGQILRKAQQQSENIQSAGEGITQAESASEGLRLELDKLREENQHLLDELEAARKNGKNQKRSAATNDLEGLIALQQEAQEHIASLQAENERLQSALRGQGISVLSPDEFFRIETELRATLQEIALLQNQLAEANARNLLLESEIRQSALDENSEDREVITSAAQEIRQPLATIVGYTDLLLAESVGILGATQRKFLERVRSATERLQTMLADLIQVSSQGEGSFDLLTRPVEFGAIIDEAMEETSAQLREKDITLHVDLPQEMPKVFADRDAILQIVVHLLQNAGTATPPEGAITLRIHQQQDQNEEYLLMQVTDTGDGIQLEDLPRVFARRYRAEMPLIHGLGDTGIGLSIAKALVDAHNGRIWVESTPGKGTTFSVLLPIRPRISAAANKNAAASKTGTAK